MEDLFRALWKGGTQPTSFPHLCPYRQNGAEDKQACIELGGKIPRRNQDGCCGTQRGNVKFAPCNSAARRCVKCLESGRSGLKANVVTNVLDGTCDEHAKDAQQEEPRSFRLPSTPGTRPVGAPRRTPVDIPAPHTGTLPIPPDTDQRTVAVEEGVDEPVEPAAAPVTAPTLVPEQGADSAPDIELPKPDQVLEVKDDTAADTPTTATGNDALIEKGVENVQKLKGRNLRFFRLCGQGLDNVEIAALEETTSGTVGVSMADIYRTLGVHDQPRGIKRQTVKAIYDRFLEKGGQT